MHFNLNYTIDAQYLRFEEINKDISPGEVLLIFSYNNIYFDFEFDYKFIRGCTEPQAFEPDYYQLFVTAIKQIKDSDSEIVYTLNTSQSEKLIQYINQSFEETLQFDDDNIFLN